MRRVFLVLLIVSGGSVSCFAQTLGQFNVPTTFQGDLLSEIRAASGNGPTSIATGDLNGDGHLDVAVANGNDGTIGIYLGNGDGTLQPPSLVTLPAGSFPLAIALADLNGDGKLDLVEADYNNTSLASGGAVRVMLGNGDGTFQPAVSYVAGTHLTAVVVADFNRDGKPDVAAVDNASGSVSILLNDGTGQLSAPVSYASGVGSFDLAAADLAKTGKLDLVVTNRCQSDPQDPFGCLASGAPVAGLISVLRGNGDGTFQAASAYGHNLTGFKVTLADFNGDGFPDVAVTTPLGAAVAFGFSTGVNSVVVALGLGDGSFGPFDSYFTGGSLQGIVSGDFNSDSKLELMTDCAELRGNGDGTFEAPVNYCDFSGLPDTGGAVNVADLNGDGHPDLVARTAVSSVGVFLNAFGKTRQATTVTAVATPNPGFAGNGITITAAVSTNGAAQPGGTVNFYVSQGQGGNADLVGIGPLDTAGHASTVFGVNALGTYNIAVIYAGDTLTQGSVSPVFQEQVTKLGTSTSVSSETNPSNLGQAITFDLQVVSGTAEPFEFIDGDVNVFDGPNLLGTTGVSPVAEKVGISRGKFVAFNLAAGQHSITAVYGGNSKFGPSTSNIVVQQVMVPLTITATAGTATINAGDTATYNLNLKVGASGGSVNFSCSGAPGNSSCSVNPPTATVAPGDTIPFTVSVVTQARGTTAGVVPSGPPQIWPATAVSLVFLFFLVSVERAGMDRRRMKLAFVLAGVCALPLAIGCRGSGSSPKAMGTPPGSYTIVASVTLGANTVAQNLTLVVK